MKRFWFILCFFLLFACKEKVSKPVVEAQTFIMTEVKAESDDHWEGTWIDWSNPFKWVDEEKGLMGLPEKVSSLKVQEFRSLFPSETERDNETWEYFWKPFLMRDPNFVTFLEKQEMMKKIIDYTKAAIEYHWIRGDKFESLYRGGFLTKDQGKRLMRSLWSVTVSAMIHNTRQGELLLYNFDERKYGLEGFQNDIIKGVSNLWHPDVDRYGLRFFVWAQSIISQNPLVFSFAINLLDKAEANFADEESLNILHADPERMRVRAFMLMIIYDKFPVIGF